MGFFIHPVVLVRHGQTKWNLQRKTQGHLDAPLTEQGREQAKEVARKLGGYQFDLVLSSPLGRALATTEILKAELGIHAATTAVPDLAERNLGILQGRTQEESMREFPHFWDSVGRFIQSSEIPGAESFENFLYRVKNGTEHLRNLSKDNRILAITHDGVLNVMTAYVKNMALDQVQARYTFRHGEPIIFE